MQILLIHQFFLEDHDGGGSRWNEMSRIWKAAGHNVTVIAGMTHYMGANVSRNDRHFFRVSRNQDDIEVIRCFVSQSSKSVFGRIASFFSFSISGILGGLFYAKDNYDLIIITSPPLFVGITGLFLSRWKNIPFIFEVRDLWPESAIDLGLLKIKQLIRLSYWFEKYLYRKAKLINVLTPAFRDVLIAKGADAKKIIYIPNAADFSLSEKVMSTFNESIFRQQHRLTGKFLVTYVGAHGFANHLIQILETAELLADTNVVFLLIGDGEQKRYLIQEAQQRNLQNVRFIDSVSKSEVFNYILASDMGTSVLKKTDTFKTIYSNKTFDYFSCKKPVLMAIDGVSRELVEGANAGVFVEPENPADFAAKIRFYLDNPLLIKQQGENGYWHAKNHFDRQVLAMRYLNYIREV
ncbi:Glycosyltransferase involved in cell wall bisynthesis [Dyadobacter koreensis]|uniref:Glycosyltransferase involved in cell wall bisynthesis n=1 Tax=Dyadobacter koreensis TaxID=408657 RepID=A0A1H6W8S0_9BACT|nr:glycosyltransferase family 4 protein [Dyadobacter koreensis]SEJ13441.1 Glycosyltransferase involved in cell wall bisynthesis [Dyadobacter koreensis]